MAFPRYSQRDRFFRESRDRLERESEEEREYEEEELRGIHRRLQPGRVDKPRGNNNNNNYNRNNNNYNRNNNNYNQNNNNYNHNNNNYNRNNNNYNKNNNNYNQNDNYYNHRETNEEEKGLRMEVEKYKKLWKDTEEKMLLIANTYQRVIKSLLKQNSDAISNNKTAMEAEKCKELWEQSEESKARLEELYQRDIKDLYDDRRDAANDMAAKEKKFDNKLKALEAKLSNEKILNEALSQEVTMLKTREEEHALSVAENKTEINSELESKESELRKLKVQLESNKKNYENNLAELNFTIQEMKKRSVEDSDIAKELEEAKKKMNKDIEVLQRQIFELQATNDQHAQERDAAEREAREKETKVLSLTRELDEAYEKIEDLETKRKALQNELESKFMDFEQNILDLEKENHRMKTDIIKLEQQKSDLNKKLAESFYKSEKLLNEKDTLSIKVQELEENSKCFNNYEKVTSFKGPNDNFCVIKEKTQNKLTSTLKQIKKAHAEKAVSEYRNTKTRLKLQQLQETTYDNENFFQEPPSQIKQETAHTKEEATIASLAKMKDFEPLDNLLNEIDSLRECVFSEKYECLTELLWDDHG